ncbi:MFS transporter [Actinopolymorpha rutila]|uniref:YNFM family putative membrane transporter n=1 Tax=Actinopolymorpha rutila TaxID=446787 RepID=A0A852ZHF0_9ACTN|nr:MFS transporter [Actinopolymorpha rutila]NYH89029.1 YNFM family putative membrane transporter [Actinopolymorpha rutila]
MTAVVEAPAPTDQGHRPGTAGYRRVVGALFAAGVATFALIYSTQAILPELAARFGVSTAASTLTVSLTTLGLGVMLLVAGPLSDVVGRTRLIHLSLIASAVVAAAGALAPSWPALLASRLAEGAVLAGLPAVATAYLREELHPSTHARAAGLYVGGTALGGMVGRLLTASVAEFAGWRWALASTACLGLVCALAVRSLLPPSRHFVPQPTGLRALARTSLRAVTDPGLLALYGVGGCSMGALVAVFNTMGFRLTQGAFGLGLGAAGLVFLVYPVGSISSTAFGRLADKYGRRTVLPLACLLTVAGALLTLPSSLVVVIAGLAVFTGGFFAVHGVASGWVPARAHAGGVSTGQAASLYLFTYYLGSSVFGSVAGRAWTGAGWPGVVILATVLLAATGALTLLLRRTPALVSGAR